MIDAITPELVLDALLVVVWGACLVFLVAAWVPPLVGRSRRWWTSEDRSWWDLVPPYDPPEAPGVWKTMAKLRLVHPPKKPCGCRAEWDDVTFTCPRRPDGTLLDTIGTFAGDTREYVEYRSIVETDGGASLQFKSEQERSHVCSSCGTATPIHTTILSGTDGGRPVATIDRPLPARTMRGLPDGWTRADGAFDGIEAGRVTGYVVDGSWGAFVDVFDTSHQGNDYDEARGRYCAVLLAGGDSLSARDEHYGDDFTSAAKPLMAAYNRGEHE